MSKQVLIYDNIQPITDKHLNWSMDIQDHKFISHLNSVPLVAAEIPLIAGELPIIFSALPNEGEFLLLAMYGLMEGQNLLLDENFRLTTHYTPGFIRRYPFIPGSNEKADFITICIDEDSDVFVKDGSRGEKLFESNGEQSKALLEAGEFLRDYHYRADQTQVFCRHIYNLGLLEPMEATITLKDKATINLNGFYVVNREKLKALGDADVLDLFKKDGLELIYAHLQSLSQLNRLIDLASQKMGAQ